MIRLLEISYYILISTPSGLIYKKKNWFCMLNLNIKLILSYLMLCYHF